VAVGGRVSEWRSSRMSGGCASRGGPEGGVAWQAVLGRPLEVQRVQLHLLVPRQLHPLVPRSPSVLLHLALLVPRLGPPSVGPAVPERDLQVSQRDQLAT
jgi:hypothetical protein